MFKFDFYGLNVFQGNTYIGRVTDYKGQFLKLYNSETNENIEIWKRKIVNLPWRFE